LNRNNIIIGIMVAVLGVMVWAGYWQSHPGKAAAVTAMAGNLKGQPAPDFQLTDVRTGKPVRLSDYRGKAVLLNFWATWCPPCKVEIPWFVDLQKHYEAQGFAVLGVAVLDDSGQQEIAKFANEMSINYPVLLDTVAVSDQYGNVEALPTTFYIGRDGRIVKRVFGLSSHEEVEENIKATLSEDNSRVAQAQPAAGGQSQ
jgi:peroxiredoxin